MIMLTAASSLVCSLVLAQLMLQSEFLIRIFGRRAAVILSVNTAPNVSHVIGDVDDAVRSFNSLELSVSPRLEFIDKYTLETIMAGMAKDIVRSFRHGD